MSDWRRNVYAGLMMVLAATMAAATAQTIPQPSPSPFAPGDLKRPIFDTVKPAYDMARTQEESARSIVAEIDGRAVTLGDVGDAVADLPASVQHLPFMDLFPIVLDRLVRQQALVIRAQRLGLDEDPVVQRRIKAASDRVVANALLEHEAAGPITEAALLERYQKDIAGRPGPEEVHVRVIMAATEAEAAAIIAELRGGADFGTVARRSSKDSTAVVGGDAAFVTRDGLTPEIGAVVFSLPPGQLTPYPVRSAGGWFVLKIDERRPQRVPSFAAVREDVRQMMLREGGAAVVTTAMKDVTVRAYDITGKEADRSAAADPRQR